MAASQYPRSKGLHLPANLAAAVARSGSAARRDWAARLPATVRALARRWSLTVGPPFQPGGEVSWVAPVRDASGRELVLKVGCRHDESEHEAEGLRAWRGRGAVELHDSCVDDHTSALLLQRCRPGVSLGDARPEPEQDEVVAGLLRGLWHEPPAGHPFRPLAQMCDDWAAEFEQRYALDPQALDPGLARAGMALLRGLPREAGPRVLLATDLHAGNVLAHHAERQRSVHRRRAGWRVIDPKPYVGDPAYDVLQHLLNCEHRLVTEPRRLADRMAGLLDLDAERVARWLLARTVQESPGQPWMRPVAAALAAG